MNHFAVHLNLTQYCKPTILQLKKKVTHQAKLQLCENHSYGSVYTSSVKLWTLYQIRRTRDSPAALHNVLLSAKCSLHCYFLKMLWMRLICPALQAHFTSWLGALVDLHRWVVQGCRAPTACPPISPVKLWSGERTQPEVPAASFFSTRLDDCISSSK